MSPRGARWGYYGCRLSGISKRRDDLIRSIVAAHKPLARSETRRARSGAKMLTIRSTTICIVGCVGPTEDRIDRVDIGLSTAVEPIKPLSRLTAVSGPRSEVKWTRRVMVSHLRGLWERSPSMGSTLYPSPPFPRFSSLPVLIISFRLIKFYGRYRR